MEATDIIKRIRKIEITTRNIVNDLFSGEYHSLFKGQGLEFSEVREYQDGDSYRQIDWNVSARMGAPYIKKFEETRELNVIFLVDASASTLFGTRHYLKSEMITEIAGVLSFSALSNNDKVGLLLFTDQKPGYRRAKAKNQLCASCGIFSICSPKAAERTSRWQCNTSIGSSKNAASSL
jgi:uncharacterized protein (DUF58 family)